MSNWTFSSRSWGTWQGGHTAGEVAEQHAGDDDLIRAATYGLVCGLAGTLVMDLFGAGLFLLMGGPASLSFSVIGDAAAGFMALLGADVAGGFPPGAALHYLIGLALGVLFVTARQGPATRLFSCPSRTVGLGVLYVEAMSLPMLTAAAVILRMTAAETAQWFGISFVMHLVYGLVLGAMVAYRPSLPNPTGRG